MARYVLATKGPPRGPDVGMDVDEEVVDIFKSVQLEEHFLTKVNNKGLVPVLMSQAWDKSLPDSVDITFYVAERYPRLCPTEYKDEIGQFILKLHGLNFFSLSFGTRPQQADRQLAAIDEILKRDINDQYREALNYKRQYTIDHKWKGVQPNEVEQNEFKARNLMKKLDGLIPPNGGWLFGLGDPTALDCHLVVFLQRMKDVGRLELLTERLLAYLDLASETEEFKRVMQGGKTMAPV